MAQFDVYKNPRSRAFPLLLDVQAGLLQRLETRVVVPLVSARGYPKPIARLNPVVQVAGSTYVVVFQDIASTLAAALGERVGSLADRRADMIAALDLLVTGF